MFTFTRYLVFFTFLLFSALALPLASRDVVDPPITSPKAGTVWHVGQTQTVAWSTTGLPANQTNPIGRLVLGYLYNNSENLMLDSPLATNLNYSVGQAQITVPDVPTRSDYIVVLFGDSGNASPQFTIINDTSSSTSVASSSVPATPPSQARSTPGSTPSPSPAKSNFASSGGSSPKPTSQTSATTARSQATSSTSTTSNTSTTVVVTSSATPPSTGTNAAWQNRVPGPGISFGVALAIYFAFS